MNNSGYPAGFRAGMTQTNMIILRYFNGYWYTGVVSGRRRYVFRPTAVGQPSHMTIYQGC